MRPVECGPGVIDESGLGQGDSAVSSEMTTGGQGHQL